jgi:hypothetical protein
VATGSRVHQNLARLAGERHVTGKFKDEKCSHSSNNLKGGQPPLYRRIVAKEVQLQLNKVANKACTECSSNLSFRPLILYLCALSSQWVLATATPVDSREDGEYYITATGEVTIEEVFTFTVDITWRLNLVGVLGARFKVPRAVHPRLLLRRACQRRYQKPRRQS